MNSTLGTGSERRARNAASVNFGLWFAVTFLGHTIGMAFFVGLWGALILDIPVRKLLLPYALLLEAGLVFSPLLYWARLARARPKAYARRLGIALFGYMLVLMFDLAIGVIRVGILSQRAVVHAYAPALIPFAALASLLSYMVVRRKLEARAPCPPSVERR